MEHDIVVIGGGAAGLTAAQYAARANLNTLLVEQTGNGGQCLLIEGLENYPGFPDPINGYEFAERFERQARQFGAHFMTATVNRLAKRSGRFRLDTSEGEVLAKAVVLATGAAHRHLGVPGEEELAGRGVSYCATCDGPFFKDKTMVVVGGGDAACDEATFLAKLSDHIILVHRRDRFRAQPAVARRVLDNQNIEVRFNTVVREIRGTENPFGMKQVSSVVLEQTNDSQRHTYEQETDAVFVFIGSNPRTDLVDALPKDEAGYIITNERMETAVSGLFAAGDVRATPFRQLVVAAGEGAIAAHAAAAYIEQLEVSAVATM